MWWRDSKPYLVVIAVIALVLLTLMAPASAAAAGLEYRVTNLTPYRQLPDPAVLTFRRPQTPWAWTSRPSSLYPPSAAGLSIPRQIPDPALLAFRQQPQAFYSVQALWPQANSWRSAPIPAASAVLHRQAPDLALLAFRPRPQLPAVVRHTLPRPYTPPPGVITAAWQQPSVAPMPRQRPDLAMLTFHQRPPVVNTFALTQRYTASPLTTNWQRPQIYRPEPMSYTMRPQIYRPEPMNYAMRTQIYRPEPMNYFIRSQPLQQYEYFATAMARQQHLSSFYRPDRPLPQAFREAMNPWPDILADVATDHYMDFVRNSLVDFGATMSYYERTIGREIFAQGGIPSAGSYVHVTNSRLELATLRAQRVNITSRLAESRALNYSSRLWAATSSEWAIRPLSYSSRSVRTWLPADAAWRNTQRLLRTYDVMSVGMTLAQGLEVFDDTVNRVAAAAQMISPLPAGGYVHIGPDHFNTYIDNTWTYRDANLNITQRHLFQQTMPANRVERVAMQRYPSFLFDVNQPFREVRITHITETYGGYERPYIPRPTRSTWSYTPSYTSWTYTPQYTPVYMPTYNSWSSWNWP